MSPTSLIRKFVLLSSLAAFCSLLGACVANQQAQQEKSQAAIHRRLGIAYLDRNELVQAMSEFEKGLSLQPKDAEMLHGMGLAFLLSNQIDKAESYLNRTIEASNDIPDAYNHLGVVYILKNRPMEAVEVIEKALANPRFGAVGKAYYNKGKAYLLMDRQSDAVDAFETSIERNPSDIRAYLTLADLHLQRRDFALAEKAAERALRFYPKSFPAWFRLAKAQLGLNKRAEALEAFSKTRQYSPPESEESKTSTYYLKILQES